MLEIQPVTLEGQHVRLEPLSFAHEDALNTAAADGELWNTQVTIIPRPEGMKDYIQFALDGLAQKNQLPFVIVRKSADLERTPLPWERGSSPTRISNQIGCRLDALLRNLSEGSQMRDRLHLAREERATHTHQHRMQAAVAHSRI